MDFQFASLTEFWLMAGHGSFVWACYGITLLAIAGLAYMPKMRRKKFYRSQRALLQREKGTSGLRQ